MAEANNKGYSANCVSVLEIQRLEFRIRPGVPFRVLPSPLLKREPERRAIPSGCGRIAQAVAQAMELELQIAVEPRGERSGCGCTRNRRYRQRFHLQVISLLVVQHDIEALGFLVFADPQADHGADHFQNNERE